MMKGEFEKLKTEMKADMEIAKAKEKEQLSSK